MSEDINNPVYKLMTANLQLVLINVLKLGQFVNIKVSQASVPTRLSYGGIFNGQFVTQSPLSPPEGEKMENRSTFAEVMGQNQVSCRPIY